MVARGVASARSGAFKALMLSLPRPEDLPSLPFWSPGYHSTSLSSGRSTSAAAFAEGVAILITALGIAVAPVGPRRSVYVRPHRRALAFRCNSRNRRRASDPPVAPVVSEPPAPRIDTHPTRTARLLLGSATPAIPPERPPTIVRPAGKKF